MNSTQRPSNMKWGQAIAFDFDSHGDVYVFHRNDPGILKFSPEGKLPKSWGVGMFVMAHGITVDRFGYIWTADSDARDGNGWSRRFAAWLTGPSLGGLREAS